MTKINNEIFTMFYLPKRRSFLRCFDPSRAWLQYKSFRIDLLTGFRVDKGAGEFLEELAEYKLEDFEDCPKVFHLFYELGFFVQEMENHVKENVPLGIFLDYRHSETARLNEAPKEGFNKDGFKIDVLQYPEFEEYKKNFELGMERLHAGDCYQLNLTRPFFFKLDVDYSVSEVIAKAWSRPENISAYAHCTYIGTLNKLYLSNSPECLFQYKSKRSGWLYSMPIKGTFKVQERGEKTERDAARKAAWEALSNSEKDQAELFMITDLVRNDLSKVQFSPAKVVAKKLPLHVPGIVHQYSLVATAAQKDLTLKNIVGALFPGGSVTGAPKKKVMGILGELEHFQRGFYCGSTVVLHKSLKAASINIRSCELDCSTNELKYCAGGGITLNSEVRAEFEEAYTKMESFLHLLKD